MENEPRKLTPQQHKARHEMLHRCLDELIADWVAHTRKLPSKAKVRELMHWSYQQTLNPSEDQ